MSENDSTLFPDGWSLYPCHILDDRYWRQWDRLNNDLNSGTPALDSAFLRPRCDILGGNALQMAACIESGNILVLMLIIKHRAGEWHVFCPGQACNGANMIAPDLSTHAQARILPLLIRRLSGLGWRIAFPKQDVSLSQLTAVGPPNFDSQDHSIITNVAIDGEFDTFWAGWHNKVRGAIRRVQQKLQREGVKAERVELTNPEDIDTAVAEHGRLKTAGWKGLNGTAIHENDQQGRLYRSVLRVFAEKGGSIVYQLRAGSSILPPLLTIAQNGIQIVLTTTCDEAAANLSPGRYIDYLMLARAFEQRDVRVIENYTSSKSVDRNWTTDSRPIIDVEFLYPGVVLKGEKMLSLLRRQTFESNLPS